MSRLSIVIALVLSSCASIEMTPLECADGVDNDGDGLSDCDDPDCMPLASCASVEMTPAECADGVDNDGDGLSDCDDPDCMPLAACGTSSCRATCAGCCIGDECVAGSAESACGARGSECAVCTGDQTCSGGACTAAGCGPGTCGGCCSGAGCESGTSESACGTGGGACRTCGGGESCIAGVCTGPSGCSAIDRGAFVEDNCVGEEICSCAGGTEAFCDGTGECIFAFGRRYRVALSYVMLPARRSDGMCWDDPGCGAPDPYVVVSVDGATVGMTPAAADLYEGNWSPPSTFDVNILAGSSLRLDVYDEDLAADDGAFACVFEPVTVSTLRSRSISCAGALGTLEAYIFYVP